MKYKVVLNAWGDLPAQCEELSGALEAFQLPPDDGCAVVLHGSNLNTEELCRLTPTKSLELVQLTAYQPENALEALVYVHKENPAPVYLFCGDYAGRELSVRLSVRLHGSAAVDVDMLTCAEGCCIETGAYAGNLRAKLSLLREPYCISIAKTLRTQPPSSAATICGKWDFTHLAAKDFVVSSRVVQSQPVHGLKDAKFVLAAGRGVKSREAIEMLMKYSKRIGAQFGVSRPIAMNAWAPMETLIGVSGHLLTPSVCIAAAVSGAGAFLAGIDHSEYLVSINTDQTAAIHRAADVAIVDDYAAVIEELVRILETEERETL